MKTRQLSGIAAVLLLFVAMLPVQGCNSATTIKALVPVVANAVTQVLTLEGDTAQATRVQQALTAFQTATANWKSGTPSQDVVEAINALAAALDAFPLTSQYAPLIGLALTTLDAILAIVAPGTLTPNVRGAARRNHEALKALYGKPAPQSPKAFRKAWEDTRLSHGLTAAPAL